VRSISSESVTTARMVTEAGKEEPRSGPHSELLTLAFFLNETLVVLLNGLYLLWLEALQKFEQLGWLKRIKVMVSQPRIVRIRALDENDRSLRLKALKLPNQILDWHAFDAGINDDAINIGEFPERFHCLRAAIRSNDV
jgi:hypothetical protein